MRFLKLILVTFFCIILLTGCSGYELVTDVDTEEEILAIMKESGQYKFFDDVNVQDLSDLFCNVTEETESASDESTVNDPLQQESFADEIPSETEAKGTEYILNTSSKKFHLPGCSAANKILDKNLLKQYGRDSIVAEGYIPCKICKP